MSFVPYRIGDVFQLTLRENDDYGTETIYEYDDNDVAFTLLVDDQPAACFGIVEADKGVGFLWGYVSDRANGHGKYMIRFLKGVLDRAMGRYHRLQSNVRADRKDYIRFSELLGLEKEALMRKATANKMDLWLFARVE